MDNMLFLKKEMSVIRRRSMSGSINNESSIGNQDQAPFIAEDK